MTHPVSRLYVLRSPEGSRYLPDKAMMASTSAGPALPHVATGAASVWVVFGCEERAFGFPLERVREILLPRPFTRLPGCGPEVCGLIGFRGRIVTVFDLGAVLGLRAAAERPETRLLLTEVGGRTVACAVEVVEGVRPATITELGRRRTVLRGIDVDRDAVLGTGEIGGRTFLALDSDRILGGLLL